MLPATPRARIHRHPERASFDRDLAYKILDEGLICHLGFVRDGAPVVIPTFYARLDDRLVVHGSPSAGMLKAGREGSAVCATVTLIDELVLARSAFNHSANYRSVVVHGRMTRLDGDAKRDALDRITDHLVPGRRPGLRPLTEREIRATEVLGLPLQEVSVKIRSGPPIDEEEDYGFSVWAGLLPLTMVAGTPIPDPRLIPGIEAPEHLLGYTR